MNYFKLMTKNSYDWGRLKKNEDLYLEASLISGEVYDIYFDVAGSRPIYTYFDLYDFTDDLDLHLYRYNAILDEYEKISSSTEEGTEEEEIFKGVTPGEYVLQISLYKDIGAKNSSANFERIQHGNLHRLWRLRRQLPQCLGQPVRGRQAGALGATAAGATGTGQPRRRNATPNGGRGLRQLQQQPRMRGGLSSGDFR